MLTGNAVLFPLKGGSLTQSLFTIMFSVLALMRIYYCSIEQLFYSWISFTSFSQSLCSNLPPITLFLPSYLLLQPCQSIFSLISVLIPSSLLCLLISSNLLSSRLISSHLFSTSSLPFAFSLLLFLSLSCSFLLHASSPPLFQYLPSRHLALVTCLSWRRAVVGWEEDCLTVAHPNPNTPALLRQVIRGRGSAGSLAERLRQAAGDVTDKPCLLCQGSNGVRRIKSCISTPLIHFKQFQNGTFTIPETKSTFLS